MTAASAAAAVLEDSPVPPAAVPIASAPVAPVAIGFQNKTSVRTALIASLVMFFGGFALTQASGTAFFLLVALIASGVLSVYLYFRRTGYRMTPIEGARHGWISGLFFFVYVLVVMTLFLIAIMSVPDIGSMLREQLKAQGSLTPEVTSMIETMSDPGKLAGSILASALLSFVLFTSLSSLGGVLGARLFGAKPRP